VYVSDTDLHNRSAKEDAELARLLTGHVMKKHRPLPAALFVTCTCCTTAVTAVGLGLIHTPTKPVLALIQLLATTRQFLHCWKFIGKL
jgi:hypothetical protein